MFKEMQEYFDTLEIDKSRHTVRSYRTALNVFVNHFNIQSAGDISKLTESDIQIYLNVLASKSTAKNSNTAKASANANFRVVKAFLNWMKTKGYIEFSPVGTVHRYKEAKHIGTIFSKDERDNIIMATKKRPSLQMMMTLMFYTGLRAEESVNVKVNDIQNGVLKVHGKGNKERELALTPFVIGVINNYLKNRKHDSDYLITSMRGGHQITTTSVLERVKVACRMAGIDEDRIEKLSPHSVRRSFACFLLMDGWSTFAIQSALGHQSPSTTSIYVEPAKSLVASKAMLEQPAPSWYRED